MSKRIVALVLLLTAAALAQSASNLYARGYSLLPAPQRVELAGPDFEFRGDWSVEEGPGAGRAGAAAETLTRELAERLHFQLASSAARRIRLVIAPGAVLIGDALDRDHAALAAQAYRLDLAPERIEITANAPAGLFYGAVTLAQLARLESGRLWLPRARITDWPDLRMRTIYWDDAHHLEKLDELKRAVRQAALFKINAFTIKLEGHFQFRNAPALVEPYALSPAQFQELTDYGLRYFVQVVPYLDAPAHIAFILKHPEYAPFRAFASSNYELCTVNPNAVKLIEEMFQDLLDANRGVDYVYLSTDEAYYVGMADSPQCREKPAAQAKGSVGKLLAGFVSEVANYLRKQGRTVVFWGEYPLKVSDIAALPPHLVNGEVNDREFNRALKAHGIRQTIYTSTQGEERFFPDYFVLPDTRRLHPARGTVERVSDGFRQISQHPARGDSELIGAVVAGWADAGLHPETFWLGYATITAAAWKPAEPDGRQLTAAFYPLFYGPEVVRMDRLYQLLSMQAQAWFDLWDMADSRLRKPIFGDSQRVFDPPHPAEDQVLPLPPVPSGQLAFQSSWRGSNARRLELAAAALVENDELRGLLHENGRRAARNQYNLEVSISIAGLLREGFEMLLDIGRMDAALETAQAAAAERPQQALAAVDEALETARRIQERRDRAWMAAVKTWYKSWHPRVFEANGRKFLHHLDDVKDHLPDRTADMSYLVYREKTLPFGEWVEAIRAARNRFAASRSLPANRGRLEWAKLPVITPDD